MATDCFESAEQHHGQQGTVFLDIHRRPQSGVRKLNGREVPFDRLIKTLESAQVAPKTNLGSATKEIAVLRQRFRFRKKDQREKAHEP